MKGMLELREACGGGLLRPQRISKLSHEARREIMRCLIQVEADAATLAECDSRALERFQMLDAMEAEAGKNVAR